MSLPPPLLLSIDCCDQRTIVGLVSGDQVIAVAQTPPDVRSAISLVPTIQSLYQAATLRLQQDRTELSSPQYRMEGKTLGLGDTEVVAITYGPGSFTSLRIGLTVAKTLAYAGGLPLLGINSLDVLLAAGRATCSSGSASAADAGRSPNSQLSERDSQPIRPKLGLATKAAYRGQYYHKAVEFGTEPVPPPSSETLHARIAAYQSRQSEGSAQTQVADSTIAQWACAQPDAAQTAVPEHTATAALWHTHRPTQMSPLGEVREQMNHDAGSAPLLLVGDLAAELVKLSDSAFHCAPPTPDERVAAMAQLAWQTLVATPSELWSPMLVQPTYYRVSAAEEATR